MKPDFEAMAKYTSACASPAERDAIQAVLTAGESFGYGNMMAWLATAWAKRLELPAGKSFTVTPYPKDWVSKS